MLDVDSYRSRPPAVTVERAGTYGRTGSWCYTAPTRNDSVPWLRRTVRELLRREGVPEELLQNLLLILSELTTNAVQHAALLSPEMGVEVSLVGGWLRVAVEDGHPFRPKAGDELPDDEHDGGRGLLLVEAITAQCGGVHDTMPTGSGGKVVWAALPLPRTEPSSRADGALPSAFTSRPYRP